MTTVLSEFVSIMVSGIQDLATAIGSGINTTAKAVFLEVGESGAVTGLSTAGGIIAVFAGIALAVGLTRLVVQWIGSLGARNL